MTPLQWEDSTPRFVISIAARLAEMHPQTLRQYDRLGLVVPGRAAGRGRRYSERDIELLREVQRLSSEGINLTGIRRILALEAELRQLRSEVEYLHHELGRRRRIFSVHPQGEAESVPHRPARRPDEPPPREPRPHSTALIIWRA
ncbi:MAG: MerR family transcriptional regulator [Micrococcales bacterium]|nr:MerR family transcriptional regulator [Micrococcales bacterium]